VTNQQLTLQIQEMQLWMIQNYDFPKRNRPSSNPPSRGHQGARTVKQQGSNRIAQYTADMLTQSNTLAERQPSSSATGRT
jgi:hypothetical protein